MVRVTAPDKIICYQCGFATNEDVGEDGITTKIGKCCENLPAPYRRDENGLYTIPRERPAAASAIAILQEEDEDYCEDYCDCPTCVAENIGLDNDGFEDLQRLYESDRDGGRYRQRLRELGWTG